MAILLRAWSGEAALPVRPIVLTFDDALANFFDSAAPVLNDLGFTATIFAVAGYAGRTNEWPGHPAQIPRMPLLSWHDMRELTKQGFEIGCHTMTHIPLSGLGPEDLQHEIVQSKHLLEDRLGHSVTTSTYPYGIFDQTSRRVVE